MPLPLPSSRPWATILGQRLGGAALFLGVWLGVAFLTRLALLIEAARLVSWKLSVLGAFLVGFVYDLGSGVLWAAPLVLLLAALPARFFRWRAGVVLAHLGVFVVLCVLFFVGVAEWFFWEEFGARFNFIAVDYLVYTNEVVGNIRESYPMPLIFGCIAAAAAAAHFGLVRLGWIAAWLGHAEQPARARWRCAGLWLAAAALVGLGLNEGMIPSWRNNYTRELAKSGPWSFAAAFRANKLDYGQFYATMPDDAAFARIKARLAIDGSAPSASAAPDGRDLLRAVPAPRPAAPAARLNVIQITVESLSAEYLGHFGNTKGWTPHLDELCGRSLVFENFYATGNRTDRGMEALTLAVPPTPGRSLVKRPENAGLFTLGSVFRARGYDTAFIYGGYGYFDNMNAFFGNNGYRVVDRTGFAEGEITFANAWGACDEDLFNRALREADAVHATGRQFFQFVMTTSNHRPFTYPDGRIDLPSLTSKRAGGVKYTDYAIGKLLRDAATRPWFKDTVFVIVADHCGSSAGKTQLPVEKYHIPLIIYSPGGQIPPGAVTVLSSQIDYAPSLLALLNWSYESRFFGRDVTSAAAAALPGRALIGNYQKLGLFDGDRLAILSPVRQQQVFAWGAGKHTLTPLPPDRALLDDAIAYYQTASWLFKNGRQSAATASSGSAAAPAAPPSP